MCAVLAQGAHLARLQRGSRCRSERGYAHGGAVALGRGQSWCGQCGGTRRLCAQASGMAKMRDSQAATYRQYGVGQN